MKMRRPTRDTENNYNLLEQLIEDYDISGVEVLNAIANKFGLQLFTLDNTYELAFELGFEFEEKEEDEDY
jgi:glutathione peroxidase-family protein